MNYKIILYNKFKAKIILYKNMSRRRVKEMLRNEFKNTKNKVEAHLDEEEDELPLSALIQQSKNVKKEEIVPVEEVKKEEVVPVIEVKTEVVEEPKKVEKQIKNAVDMINEKPLSQKEYEDKIKEIEDQESESEHSHSDSEHSDSEHSHSDSDSSSSSSSSESEDDYRRDDRRRDVRDYDDRYHHSGRRDYYEDDYRRDDRRRDDRRRDEEDRRRDDRRRDDRRREEDDYRRGDDKRKDKKKEEEKKQAEKRVQEETRKREEDRMKEEKRREEERNNKKSSSKAYSEDAVPRSSYKNRYDGSDDEDRKRSRPRHVRERSVERRPINNNYFKNIPEKVLMKLLKREDVNRVSSNIYDAIIDVMYKFTEAIILELAEEVKIITSNHIDLIMEFYIEDEEKELPKETLMDIKEFENVIVKIVSEKQIGIKKNALYSLQLFIECIMGKVIKGSKIVSSACKRARTGGEDVYTSFEIYML
jgi:hypothetical protein